METGTAPLLLATDLEVVATLLSQGNGELSLNVGLVRTL
jgi:hypothetical protein